MSKLQILKDYFGHSGFRPLQEEVVDAILAQQDVLMILPTGGGKSLCYQLPTLLMEGVTVVVSPLLALMHDQVTALKANGITAAMLSSMQTPEESQRTESQLKQGKIKLLYVAPERLLNPYFLNFLQQLPLNFFVIDEAHCVSEWGHEFREHYRGLSLLKERFPDTPIAAFTATATKVVEEDIAENLRLRSPKRVRGSLFRSNLTIQAQHRIKDGREQLLEFLKSHRDSSGIIYTLSRKQTESVAHFLQTKGIEAQAYHAGLSTEEKNRTYKAFVEDRIQIVVATIAFGMGIDKSNIRFVVHLSLPKTLENYYQEIGRAGRDGLDSETLLLFSAQDIVQQKSFIEALPDTPYKQHAFDKLDAMVRFANSESCRHQSIAAYFDDRIEVCSEKCDNCTATDMQRVDITEASRKLLSAIYRTGQNFGLHYLVDVLRGSKEQRVLKNGHDKTTVYGIGEEFSRNQWLTVGDKLLELGAVEQGEFKVYRLTPFGVEVLKGAHAIEIKKERLSLQKAAPKRKVTFFDDYDAELFDKLRDLRAQIAEENSIPPYIVFSDKTLKDLSAKKPVTKEEMLQVHGIGEVKYERYGEAFLELLKKE
ncbi:DNA helicase RecQ [Sulfurovum sp.]|jgi:ATP-dependent DNA helicase RecQ|uniref:DNA helicase RecQ n=1 Tax=Sulfurovum sp. TaxID=1969726 RepID=UPI002A372101|nr:DNA helicase RecQ [Sulfurovum sp.]MDD2451576.1 DNA helicase RecQ [Sulfurovum sp.]MDD3500159.1 DNA helicase RecQ [Sulfurovum sp.]MDY0403728.1 DNA helicase RecQ [Sulfurovum sp.]